MNSINTNMSALTAQANMQKVNKDMDQAITRISSGLRINSAADDAAGSAIASKMEAQVRSLDVAIRNSYDAISMTQTAEGALGEMENILQRTRELAVQAGNSTLTTSDRSMIQKELDALVSELDSIATKTNFNGIKLLDGSNESLNFQVGINKGDALNVKLEATGTKALGLEANRTVNEYTSGRVTRFDYNATNLVASDVQINKSNALNADFTTDLSTANTATNGAKLLKNAINLSSSVHNATATAFNSLTSSFKTEFAMSDTFSVNGASISLATSSAGLVDNINREATGVTATLNSNNTITLENKTGDDIIIKDAAGQGATDVGFNVSGGDGTIAAGTVYSGFISIKNNDGSAVQIEANNKANGFSTDNGTITDVTRLGFNQVNNDKSITSGSVSSGKILTSTDVKINDVAIGTSVGTSAASKAIAINAVSSETLVTASASNEVTLAVDLDANPAEAASAKKVFNFGNFSNSLTFSDGTNSVDGTGTVALETAINAISNKSYHAVVDDSTIKYDGSDKVNMSATLLAAGTTMTVDSTSGFTETGTLKIGTEYMTYSGKTDTTFTGLTRAHSGTAAIHADDAVVTQALGKTDSTIFLESVTDFSSTGSMKIGSEIITYTGIDTANKSLTGVSRGSNGSTAAVADDNAANVSTEVKILAGTSAQSGVAFGSESFTVTGGAIAQTQTITFANATNASVKYSKIELSDGSTTVNHIIIADDATPDNTEAIDALILKIDGTGEPFSNDITLTRDADGDVLTLTAKTAGTAITGSYTGKTYLAGSAGALAAGAKDLTVTGSANVADVFTLTTGSDVAGNGGSAALTMANGGVVELIASGAAAASTTTFFTEFDTNLATTISNLADKINADSTLKFTALAGANGDLQLNAKNVGASVLTDSTIVFNDYDFTPKLLTGTVAGTANTAGTTSNATTSNAVTAGIVSINGTTIDMSAADELSDVVTAINDAGIGDLQASATAAGALKITSVGGSNIGVRDTSSGFITSVTDATSTAISITTRSSSISDSDGVTAFGVLNLKSSGEGIIKVSGTDEDVLGLAAQAETQTLVSGGIKVSTLTNATQALVDIDLAIEKLSSFRASFGAVENRIDARINNLTTLKVNTEASKSRIQDADFAAETSKMTKSQILSQAATSMLAQANASKQNLLALLQG